MVGPLQQEIGLLTNVLLKISATHSLIVEEIFFQRLSGFILPSLICFLVGTALIVASVVVPFLQTNPTEI